MEEIVKNGYNAMAQKYVDGRSFLKSGKNVQKLLKLLPKNAEILDIGCGAGVGVDDLLLKAGHRVIGIDNSIEMIKMARKNCQAGEYLLGDMVQMYKGEYLVDAVVSFYAIFHIPRARHSEMINKWASYLKKDGLMLITMGDRAFEGMHNLHGEKMWSSQWGSEKNLQIVRAAGLEILEQVVDTSGAERHLVVMARKR